MVLMGPPGAGKGTQAKVLKDRFHVPHISSGDLLRNAIDRGTPLGQTARRFMEEGELVPDDVLLEVMKDRLAREDCAGGFLLDGFPRTILQAEALDGMLQGIHAVLDCVTSISVPRTELLRRMTGRRTCRSCGATYHLAFTPPSREGRCDRCQGELYQRADDKEATIAARLDVYDRQTAPLLDFYARRRMLHTVDGCGTQEQVTERIVRAGASAR